MNTYKSFLENWKRNRPNYKNFCEDGILLQEKWDNSITKIMFLLKETHNGFYIIDEPCGPDGSSSTFWRRMKIWTYVIDELSNNRQPNFLEIDTIKEQSNDSIAYVNVKKNAEREEGENSDENDLMNYAIQDKDFLIEQIRLIDPNIILCCSTFKFAKKLYPDFTIITDKVIYVDGKILINFFHPSNRKSYASQFNQLTEILTTAFDKLKGRFIFNENYKPTFSELTSIKLRKKEAIYSQEFELASSLNEREKELTQKLGELKKI